MKKLKKINLINLSKDELKKRELSRLVGGANCCICHCNDDVAAISIGGTSNNFGIQDPAGGYGTGSFH